MQTNALLPSTKSIAVKKEKSAQLNSVFNAEVDAYSGTISCGQVTQSSQTGTACGSYLQKHCSGLQNSPFAWECSRLTFTMDFWGGFDHLISLSLLLVKHSNIEGLPYLLWVCGIQVGILYEGRLNSTLSLFSHSDWFREAMIQGQPISIIPSSWLAFRPGMGSSPDWCKQSESWDSCRSYLSIRLKIWRMWVWSQ